MTSEEKRLSRNESNRKYYKKVRLRRKDLLSTFPCICCGDPDDTVIQWHHVDSSNKIFSLFDSARTAENTWWDEVLKCIPVCANCHLKIHKEKLCLIPPKLRQINRTGFKLLLATENIYVQAFTFLQ